MTIQIYGSKKCFATKKAERFFKERNVEYQWIDLPKYGIPRRLFDMLWERMSPEELIDPKSSAYRKLYMEYRDPNTWEETLFANPALFRTPIVRNKQQMTIGDQPQAWQEWV